ncbi:TPA: hypothetical protein ACGFW3_003538, partial [Vibrio cholerae]
MSDTPYGASGAIYISAYTDTLKTSIKTKCRRQIAPIHIAALLPLVNIIFIQPINFSSPDYA